jgi:hypothetical protein
LSQDLPLVAWAVSFLEYTLMRGTNGGRMKKVMSDKRQEHLIEVDWFWQSYICGPDADLRDPLLLPKHRLEAEKAQRSLAAQERRRLKKQKRRAARKEKRIAKKKKKGKTP